MRDGRPCFPYLLAFGMAGLGTADRAAAETVQSALVLPKEQNPWVGQKVTFWVEVAVPGRFSGATQVDLPTVPGAIVLLTSPRPALGSRSRNGIEYSVQTYEIALFPETAGRVEIPPVGVRCGSTAGAGGGVEDHRATVDGFTVTARLPPGSKPGERVVCTANLETTVHWNPVPGKAAVGDAFTRVVTLKAEGVPGMLLPAVAPPTDLEGLGVYPQPASVVDRTERGEFRGERRETTTFVCERAGRFEVPGTLLRWWDPERGRWRESPIPAVELDVGSPPETTADGPPRAKGGTAARSWWPWSLGGLVAFAAGGVAFFRRWHALKNEEARRFDDLVSACRREDPRQAYRAYGWWWDAFTRRQTRRSVPANSALLEPSLSELQEAVIDPRRAWDRRHFIRQLRALRKAGRPASAGRRVLVEDLNEFENSSA